MREENEVVATTKMSSKGQVVIPEEIRRRLRLKAGARFVVVGKGDVVVLKTLSPLALDDLDDLLADARRQARRAGLKRADVARAIAEVRRGR